MLFHHTRHLARLSKWLADPRPEAVPVGTGIWEDVFAAFYHLLRRQRRSESRLTATLHDFQRAGTAMPDGLIILDGANRIEWCNPKSEQHFGLDSKRDFGQLVTHLIRQPQFSEAVSGNYAEPLTLRSAHGGDLVLSVLIVPYEENRKLIISRDVTDRERVETMRRDFVANVSHELRTPLTVIGGFLETIADMETPNPELIRRSVPLMSDQAKRMQTLVEDLLTLSRLESEGNPAREEPVNVPDIARGLYHDALALSAGRHKVTLLLESAAWVNGAEDELRSAIGNLVSNAVRYTPAGGEIRLSTPVTKVVIDQGKVSGIETATGFEAFDTVISTVPLPFVERLMPDLPPALLKQFRAMRNIAVVCVIAKLRAPVTNNFWLNTNDPEMDIPGLVEYSNLRPLDQHVVYVPFYMPGEHPRFQDADQVFIDKVRRYLAKINPGLTNEDFIDIRASRYRYAQPICEPGFLDRLPPAKLPIDGLWVADTSYYYPEDRGISESIGFGRAMAKDAAR
jgi:signal transduction histidine kinase